MWQKDFVFGNIHPGWIANIIFNLHLLFWSGFSFVCLFFPLSFQHLFTLTKIKTRVLFFCLFVLYYNKISAETCCSTFLHEPFQQDTANTEHITEFSQKRTNWIKTSPWKYTYASVQKMTNDLVNLQGDKASPRLVLLSYNILLSMITKFSIPIQQRSAQGMVW